MSATTDDADGLAGDDAHPQFDFDGRYRVERTGGAWHLRGPAFSPDGGPGLRIDGDSKELLEKYRDVADLLNAAVVAERRRVGKL